MLMGSLLFISGCFLYFLLKPPASPNLSDMDRGTSAKTISR
jgi:hypothetical protein